MVTADPDTQGGGFPQELSQDLGDLQLSLRKVRMTVMTSGSSG